MRNILAARGPRPWFIGITGILLLFVAYLQFRIREEPIIPTIPAVSNCKELKPGMRRIGEKLGFQFDVPIKDFTIHEGTGDMPPWVHGFDLNPKNGTSSSYLDISWGSEELTMGSVPVPPALAPASPLEKRRIFDGKGNQIGEDSWGHLDNGDRWRRVRLVGWITARYGSINEKDIPSYGSVHEKDAELFDRVINSVCVLSAPGS
jgi:hypothetical protein